MQFGFDTDRNNLSLLTEVTLHAIHIFVYINLLVVVYIFIVFTLVPLHAYIITLFFFFLQNYIIFTS